MLGGGGVDGAIHAAAGPELLDVRRAVAEVRPGVRCPTGEARSRRASACRRASSCTAGPVGAEARTVNAICSRRVTWNALALATSHGAALHCFPRDKHRRSRVSHGFERSGIAVQEALAFLDARATFDAIFLVAFREPDAAILRQSGQQHHPSRGLINGRSYERP